MKVQEHLNTGILYVILGASSYGLLATFVKTAYQEGFSTAEVTLSQYLVGIVMLWIMTGFSRRKCVAKRKDILKLLLAGLSLGLVSVLYYIAIGFIDASIAVVLLMQSVWIGVLIEAVNNKVFPGTRKIVVVILVLAGTALATDLLNSTGEAIDLRGVVFGFLAAICFSIVLYSTNSIATHLPVVKRSLYMLYGGAIVVVFFTLLTQVLPFYLNLNIIREPFTYVREINYDIFWKWGILVALFGTVIPPLAFNKGFPLTGVGLGSILSTIELPVSITFAFLMLGETINSTQWLGVFLILCAVILLNLNFIGVCQLIKERKP